ncbi:hypothetical protein ACFYZ4_00770 [Streptomyces sp. NPDC001513]|uniref:hypothetical protein n=1 Tax=Streptomyces sp. NPDC001513 TaxID=3364580 RepID=UPI0036AE7527
MWLPPQSTTVAVAGPALAYGLHRYGFQATIVERAPALREGGYAVDFRITLRDYGDLAHPARRRASAVTSASI